MVKFLKEGKIVQLANLPFIPWLIYGTSTRKFLFSSADDAENIKEFASALAIAPRSIIFSHQRHTNKIKVIEKNRTLPPVLSLDGIDGFLTPFPALLLNIFTADCLPVFFADKDQPIIGIAHCGWRGTLLRLAQKMIQQFVSLGSKVENILVWFGPAICVKCYEVSAELIRQFRQEFGNELLQRGIVQGRLLDLMKLNCWQAINLGVPEKNIFSSDLCTRCRKDLFFSYRGEGKATGRSISSIMIKNQ